MNNKKLYLGIDAGSVSINLVLTDNKYKVLEKLYLRTLGKPIEVLKGGLEELSQAIPPTYKIGGCGTTGSGRELANAMVSADIVKNEITAHGTAVLHFIPEASTILEIGGQDSKIILLRNGVVSDFAMNTVCAAGTGSFLDRQASRLGIPIEQFGGMSIKSSAPVRIAGRCAVFAESDMIHKQQMGCSSEDIIKGLCDALVRNYLNNVGKGKDILPQVVFQGGVAANVGIKKAFEEALEQKVIVPDNFEVMGAIGVAILAHRRVESIGHTSFCGLDSIKKDFAAKTFECQDCSNLCEVVEIIAGTDIKARWGDRCGKWSSLVDKVEQKEQGLAQYG
ncbi:MAG TPA: acyl-CoA dehydratase activase [Bacillota bacterium]|nr:acyl-CoA dehydratase activase [Bacillota bacterium]